MFETHSSGNADDEHDQRIMHHIALGIDHGCVPMPVIASAIEHIKSGVTGVTGGLTVLVGKGTWADGAQESDYSGAIEQNVTANFFLSLTPDEQRLVWPQVRDVIRDAVERFALGCEHIHVMVWPAVSHIFTVSAASKG